MKPIFTGKLYEEMNTAIWAARQCPENWLLGTQQESDEDLCCICHNLGTVCLLIALWPVVLAEQIVTRSLAITCTLLFTVAFLIGKALEYAVQSGVAMCDTSPRPS